MTGIANTRLLVVGGHTRNIGKTALVVQLIRAFPAARWTAVKITQYGHGVCSINGETCGCAPGEHPFSLDEEHDRSDRTDTSRFLVAGAARSLWLRTKQGQLAAAMPALRERLAGTGNVAVESNSLLGLLRPAMYLAVLDPANPDFKESAKCYLDLADAFILRNPLAGSPWPGVSTAQIGRIPCFEQPLNAPLPQPLLELVQGRFLAIPAAG
jgi:hypothetical protein